VNDVNDQFIVGQDIPDDDVRPPEYSDDALALRFADNHAAKWRYVAKWGKWMHWDGKRWREDDVRRVFNLARKSNRRAAQEYLDRTNEPNMNMYKSFGSKKTITAVESLARDDQRIAATVDQWDLDPMLLNTPGGVVDLNTGTLRPARPEDYMTKITAVAPDPNCLCPLWDAFLDKIAKDEDFRKYLYRVCGYSLTGLTREHAIFFLYGLGRNGKSTFIEAISGIMGDYHITSPMETFMATQHPEHKTELARLQGARLVTAVETEEGRNWAESRIKQLTGGDPVSARFMRQDYFDYKPQFKLVLHGNHKPTLRSVNVAIKRRMNMLPFTVTITEAETDEHLGEKLRAEWPGILQKLIDGCLQWQKMKGLNPPKIVTEATEKYLADEDRIEAWIAGRCLREKNFSEAQSRLFASWKHFAGSANEEIGKSTNFYNALEAKGFVRFKDVVDKFRGLKLDPNYQAEPPVDDVPPVGKKPPEDDEFPF
jgi:putative DNA primase/helicase